MTANLLKRGLVAAAATLALGIGAQANAAATINIVNGDSAGEGFNDPTPVAPVGGNMGTTLGQQRLNAFAYAASLWGAKLDSAAPIDVLATFDPLTCTATSAVLGSAGPRFIFNFDSGDGVFLNTWYHASLTNKLVGADVVTPADDPGGAGAEIRARFNSRLGLAANCLPGGGFYLGLDNNAPVGQTNLVVVLLHEFGHGLGFSTVTDGNSGLQFPYTGTAEDLPSVYDQFVLDNTTGKQWPTMTNAERAASAVNPRNVVWTGANVAADVPLVLQQGTPFLEIEYDDTAPAGAVDKKGRPLKEIEVEETFQVGTASFGAPLTAEDLEGKIVQLIDQPASATTPLGVGLACSPLDAATALRFLGKVALIDRGTCGFTVKVKNLQDAGARAVIVADNVAGGPPAGLGGADPLITIPSVRVTLADGNRIKTLLQTTYTERDKKGRLKTKTREVEAELALDLAVRSGADAAGRAMIYTPNPIQPGSSVSHWDTSATRNLLMEPAINTDLTQSVEAPADLTLAMFRDIGW
jgi:PA domain